MFEFNKRKQNKDISDVKKLLNITRGKILIKEDIQAPVDTTMGQNQVPPFSPENAKSNEMQEIEKAIEDSTCTKYDTSGNSTIVEGFISQNNKKAIIFNYISTDSDPKIKTIDVIFLTEQLSKSINQVSSYFQIWKDSLNKM